MRSPRFLGGLVAVGLVAGSMVGPVAPADSTGLADLVLTQSDDPDPAAPGQNVTYSIAVANVPGDGTGDATGVSLADSLPAGTSFVAATSPDGTCGAPDGVGVLVCDLGTIALSDTADVSVVVTALADGTINNSASVTATETDPTPADATDVESTVVHTPTADLSLSASDDPDPVREGHDVTYLLLVSNAGPDTATGVTLTDTLPAGAAFVGASATQGACGAPEAGVVTCDLGDVPPSSSASVSIVVTAPAPGEMTNTATVAANEADPVANNSASETTEVLPRSADLRVSQVDAPDPVIVGNQVTYDVRSVNDGPDPATGVTLTDVLPSESSFVSATGDGSCEPPVDGQLSCALGTLSPDEIANVTVTVAATSVGSMVNTVSVSATEADPDPGDNQAAEVTTVAPVPPATPPTSDFDADGFADSRARGSPAEPPRGEGRRRGDRRVRVGDGARPAARTAVARGRRGRRRRSGAGGSRGLRPRDRGPQRRRVCGPRDGDTLREPRWRRERGYVLVLFGSASGLVASGSLEITKATAGVPGDPAKGEQFGYAVAMGDFDGDGVLDLAVGAQHEKVAEISRAGAVTVIPGSPSGLDLAAAAVVAPGSGKLAPAEAASGFGSVLEAADFDADGFAGLAIGVPRADVAGAVDAGAVDLVRGSAAGLNVSKAKRWAQNGQGVPDVAERGDQFGAELASGDLDADGRMDLAVAAPKEDLGGASDAGVVHILPGGSKGVRGSGSSVWSQDSFGVPGSAGGGDNWGSALAVGDVNGDGVADLAAGARYDDEAGADSAGTVNALFGRSVQGVGSANAQLWSQASPGVTDDPEPLDHFGSVLSIGRFGPGPAAGLVIGVHFEDLGGLVHAGAIQWLPGSTSGPMATESEFWSEGDLGPGLSAAAFDYFPFALSSH